jgi:hypothetical protein
MHGIKVTVCRENIGRWVGESSTAYLKRLPFCMQYINSVNVVEMEHSELSVGVGYNYASYLTR